MFDIGFSEMLVVAVVALVVLGPERLPRVARQAGQWIGRLQRYVTEVKSDINRQMEIDELRKLQSQMQDAARTVETEIRSASDSVQTTVSGLDSELRSAFDDLPAAAEPPGTPGTDWNAVNAARRTRLRLAERRSETLRARGAKLPKRPLVR